MGLLIRVEMATKLNNEPVLTPICLTSLSTATSVGANDTTVPETMPNSTENVTMAAVPEPGSQSARIRIGAPIEAIMKAAFVSALTARDRDGAENSMTYC